MDKFVDEKKDIIDNFNYFINNQNKKEFIGLLKLGKNFVTIKKGNDYYFMPSKFAGYLNNNFEIHTQRKSDNRDGRETDIIISKIYNEKPIENAKYEKHYQERCSKHNFKAHNNKRKYWIHIDLT